MEKLRQSRAQKPFALYGYLGSQSLSPKVLPQKQTITSFWSDLLQLEALKTKSENAYHKTYSGYESTERDGENRVTY